MDEILIIMEGLHNFEDISLYMNKILRNFGWEELMKTNYIFPSFMGIDEISQIIFPFLRLFAFTEKMEKVALDLSFEMELIDAANLNSAIIIKSRCSEVKKTQAVYDQVKTAMAFFGKPFSDKTQVLYKDFFKIIRSEFLSTFFSLK